MTRWTGGFINHLDQNGAQEQASADGGPCEIHSEDGAADMKCSACGTQNDDSLGTCKKCGRQLASPKPKAAGPPNSLSAKKTPFSHDEVARKLKLDYANAMKEETDRYLESIQQLCLEVMKQGQESKKMVEYVTKLVFRQFHIKEVAVGLRSASDGKYRYSAMQGMRVNIWAEHAQLSYDRESFYDDVKYKGTHVSKYTKLLLAEDEPYDREEKGTYSEHLMKASKRRALDDSIEGDYLDTNIVGVNGALLGWIEISGTWDEKLPTARAIRALEIVASLLGIALSRDMDIAGPVRRAPEDPVAAN